MNSIKTSKKSKKKQLKDVAVVMLRKNFEFVW